MSKRRKVLKWGLRIGVSLLVLAAVALVSADRYRASQITQNQQRIEAALARIDAEILKGQTPAEWHASRATGTNGWQHIAFIYDAGLAHYQADEASSEMAALWATVEQLSDFHDDMLFVNEARGDAADLNELLAQLIDATDAFAAAYQQAATADFIAVPTAEGEPYANFDGVRVIPRLMASKAMVGRCKALLALGRDAQAWEELRVFASVAAKWRMPTSLVEHMVHIGVGGLAIRFAIRQIEAGTLPADVGRELLKVPMPDDRTMVDGFEGETIWLTSLARESWHVVAPPKWFDWLTGSESEGRGMFAMSEFGGGLEARWAGTINLSREVAIALESNLAILDYLKGDSAWRPEAAPDLPEALLAMDFSSLMYRRAGELHRRLARLELELRIIELEHGPLAKQPERVAEVVSRYPTAEHFFEGDDLTLRLSSELRQRFEPYVDDVDELATVLMPIDQLRDPPEDDDD